ncbi:MAG: J domain-containing protein, partial [Acidimicrobiales bacterium]
MTPAEARRVLGLGRDDQDADRLRRAYRRAVHQHHPDRPEGDAVRFRLLGQMGEERGTLTCTARLDGPWLEVRVEEIDDDLPSLIFPPP